VLRSTHAKGLYELFHGAAPELAGRGVSNPLAEILLLAMMFRYTFGLPDVAARIEGAVRKALASGLRTADIAARGTKPCTTAEMGSAVLKAL